MPGIPGISPSKSEMQERIARRGTVYRVIEKIISGDARKGRRSLWGRKLFYEAPSMCLGVTIGFYFEPKGSPVSILAPMPANREIIGTLINRCQHEKQFRCESLATGKCCVNFV